MAETSGDQKILTGSDVITDRLLGHVTNHVMSQELQRFAVDVLGIQEAEFSRIVTDFPNRAWDRNFQVLKSWDKQSVKRVDFLIQKLQEWQEAGFISADIWSRMDHYVVPELHPAAPGPSSGGYQGSVSASTRGDLDHKWLRDLQKDTKQSLIIRCRNCMSHDWLTEGKAIPLRGYYVGLDWLRRVRKGLKDKQVPMSRIHDIFKNLDRIDGVRILISGEAGIGKSCSLAMLAMDWAEDKAPPELLQFDFVFLILLRDVDADTPIEQVIIQQHKRLKAKRVPEERVRSVLDGSTNSRVLLLMDGYDEYKEGTNSDIDDAITDTIGNCFLILTSRPGDHVSKKIRDEMDGEIQISGLSHTNIEEFATNYLQSTERAMNLLRQTGSWWQTGRVYDLLHIPIILLMVCVLFHEANESLPKSKTDIVWKIVQMCMDRSTIKHLGKRSNEIEDLDDMLFALGELSWLAFQRDTKQLLIKKSDVEKANPIILKLGLLQGTLSDEEASLDEQPQWLTFPHKLFQDFMAGFYWSRKPLEAIESRNVFESFKSSFPTEEPENWEVVKFACGLSRGPSAMVEHVCRVLVLKQVEDLRSQSARLPVSLLDLGVLDAIARETVGKSTNPFRNNVIKVFACDKVRGKRIQPNPNISFIAFNPPLLPPVLSVPRTCAVVVKKPIFTVAEVLKDISSFDQTITDLYLEDLVASDIMVVGEIQQPVFKMDPEAMSLHLIRCELPSSILTDLGSQCANCVKLKVIEIKDTDHVAEKIINRLRNMKNLACLCLCADLSESQCALLCTQLQELDHLESLDLSKTLKGDCVAHLVASINSWGEASVLRELVLQDCSLDTEKCPSLMKSLVLSKNLEWLNISNNKLGKAFERLDADVVYLSLSTFWVHQSSLTSGDIRAISGIMKKGGMSQLEELYLGLDVPDGKTFSQMLEDEPDETLEAWKVILDKTASFWLKDNNVNIVHSELSDLVDAERKRRLGNLPVSSTSGSDSDSESTSCEMWWLTDSGSYTREKFKST